jgi:hypothetical protein
MLAGSLIAECGTGRAGDKFVTPGFTCPLGILAIIEKRNLQYATKKSENDPEIHTSTTALRLPEDSVRSDKTKVPELRLVIAMVGMLMCIVREFHFSKTPAADGDNSRPVFCGSVLELGGTSIGPISPSRVASGRAVSKW